MKPLRPQKPKGIETWLYRRVTARRARANLRQILQTYALNSPALYFDPLAGPESEDA